MRVPDILLFPVGSHGDVHPFVGLGLALRARGHSVTIVTNGHFRGLIEKAGLPFVEHGSDEDYLRLTNNPELWHPSRAFGHIFRNGVTPLLRPQFELIKERSARGPVLAVCGLLAFGVRIAGEKLGVPVVTAHLQPSVMWSRHEPPALAGVPDGPRWLKNLLYWVGATFVIDRCARPETNRFRAEVGLPAMRRTPRWWHSPDLVLGLFPEWFAARQPDWPANTVLTRFPLWDESDLAPVAPAVDRFLCEGEPPIVFTPGSANRHAREFFVAAGLACQLLRRRGLLLTRFSEQLPAGSLPEGVRHFDYVPFRQLLSRTAALVHHGGIGTTAQALRAGIPQLIMPLAHDQPDNAARVKKLGAGDWLKPSRCRGPAVAARLRALLESPNVRASCRQLASKFEGDPLAPACAALEALMAKRSMAGS